MMTRRTWLRTLVLPPLILGVVCSAVVFTALGMQWQRHAEPRLEELPDPCNLVSDGTAAKLYSGELPQRESERGDSTRAFSFDRSGEAGDDNPDEEDLLTGVRSCRWGASTGTRYPVVTRGLHAVVRQYAEPRVARHVFDHLPMGIPAEVPGADEAVQATTEYDLSRDTRGDDHAHLLYSGTHRVVVREGNVVAMVVFGHEEESDEDATSVGDPPSRTEETAHLRAVAAEVVAGLSNGDTK